MVQERTLVMGVLRADTPSVSSYVNRGIQLVEEGADILSVRYPDESAHQRTLLDSVSELSRSGARICVETSDAGQAILAAERGATIVHDLSGGQDQFMPHVIREARLTLIASCWSNENEGTPVEIAMQEAAEHLRDAGVPAANLVIDPALSVSTVTPKAWQTLVSITLSPANPIPMLIAGSRPSFLNALLPDDASADDRDAATVAISLLAADAGAWAVRVHNVARTRAALRATPWDSDNHHSHDFEHAPSRQR